MRILHISETIAGGIGGFLEELIPEQIQSKHEVCLVYPSEHDSYFSIKLSANCRFPYRRTGRNIGSLLRLRSAILRASSLAKPDVIVAHSSFAGFVARLLLWPTNFLGKKIPIIYYPHGISLMLRNGQLRHMLFRSIEQVLSRNATEAIVCVSNFEQSILLTENINSTPIFVVHNGISDIPVEIQDYSTTNPTKTEINILFVGRFDKEKGLHILCSALGKVSIDYRLRVVGASTGRPTGELRFPPSTEIFGWTPRHDLAEHYSWADVVIVPSEYEALGLVAIESLRSGRPVIASRCGGLPEVVEDGRNGWLFTTGSVEELASIINSLNQNRVSSVRAACRESYLSKFTSSKMGRDLENVVQIAVSNGMGQ